MKNIYIIIMLIVVLTAIVLCSPVSKQGVNMKISLLCEDNPELDCREIAIYCRESLEKGHDCFINNQK